MLITIKKNSLPLAQGLSCYQRWYRWVRARRGGSRRRRKAPLTALDREIDMESQHLTPPSSITLPSPTLSPSAASLPSLSLSDGWPLQYTWLIFLADWVREHVTEWGRESRQRWCCPQPLAFLHCLICRYYIGWFRQCTGILQKEVWDMLTR